MCLCGSPTDRMSTHLQARSTWANPQDFTFAHTYTQSLKMCKLLNVLSKVKNGELARKSSSKLITLISVWVRSCSRQPLLDERGNIHPGQREFQWVIIFGRIHVSTVCSAMDKQGLLSVTEVRGDAESVPWVH